ncbi:MAG: zinc-binding dehydrogenase [Pseudomonadota bacterium]
MKSYWIVTDADQSKLEQRDIKIPKPKAKEILFKVHASALNRGELIVGSVVHGGPEKVGGNEGAGVIEAVGSAVKGFKVGDRVMGRARACWAEYAVMEIEQALPVPDYLTFEQAAALPLSMITAYEAMVSYGKLKQGEWVLIAGASSGAGVASIQISQVLGAKTIGTSGSADKLAKLKAAGLDVGIQSRAPDFSNQAREATGGAGVNLAVNYVGGTFFPEILKSLANKGRVAIVGYVDGSHHAEIDLSAVHANRFEIFGISNAKMTAREKARATRLFKRDILPGYYAKRLAPVVDSVYAFEDLPDAKARMESNALTGKIVVKVS